MCNDKFFFQKFFEMSVHQYILIGLLFFWAAGVFNFMATKARIGTELVKITSYSFQVCCDSDRKVIEDAEIGWEWDFYFPIIEWFVVIVVVVVGWSKRSWLRVHLLLYRLINLVWCFRTFANFFISLIVGSKVQLLLAACYIFTCFEDLCSITKPNP